MTSTTTKPATTWRCGACGRPETDNGGYVVHHHATACEHITSGAPIHDLGDDPDEPGSVAIYRAAGDDPARWGCGDHACPETQLCAHCWSKS